MCIAIENCPSGATAYMTCSNSIYTETLTGGIYSTPTTYTIDMSSSMSQCSFTSATYVYSTCSSDIYGGTCSCCIQANLTGMSAFFGTCVSETSNIYLIKSSVPALSSMYLKFFGLFLLFLSALTL